MIEVIQVSILNPHTLLLQNETKMIVVCFDSLQQKKEKGEVVWYKICKNKAKNTVQHFVEQGKRDNYMAPFLFRCASIS